TTVTSADLSITKSAAPDLVTVGDRVTYTLTVHNAGPTASRGATVQDRLPPEVTRVSASPSQGACTGTTQISCDLGPIAADTTAAVSIVVDTHRSGEVTNTAEVAGHDFDPVANNNTSTAKVDVTSANLSMNKTASPDSVAVGQPLTYTLTVKNAGP